MRCPCCEAFVSEAAFHKKDLLTTFFVGEGVLGWPKAHRALKLVRSQPAHGRQQMLKAVLQLLMYTMPDLLRDKVCNNKH